MNEFVNFKKRGVTLPRGCKDLIDLLAPPVQQTLERAQHAVVTRNETIAGTLSEVGRYVQMTFESRGLMFTLVISSPDRRLEVDLSRMKGGELWASAVFQRDREQEQAVREFFVRRGLEVPEDSGTPSHFFADLPVQLIYPISPLPGDAASLSALLMDLFRQTCRLEGNAQLSFHCEEASDAA
jgi:hypothetical protein